MKVFVEQKKCGHCQFFCASVDGVKASDKACENFEPLKKRDEQSKVKDQMERTYDAVVNNFNDLIRKMKTMMYMFNTFFLGHPHGEMIASLVERLRQEKEEAQARASILQKNLDHTKELLRISKQKIGTGFCVHCGWIIDQSEIGYKQKGNEHDEKTKEENDNN